MAKLVFENFVSVAIANRGVLLCGKGLTGAEGSHSVEWIQCLLCNYGSFTERSRARRCNTLKKV